MNKLQELGFASDLTRRQLSEISGVNLRSIEAYEQEKKDINNAKLETLIKLCIALECDLEDILTDEYVLNYFYTRRLGRRLEDAYMQEPVKTMNREEFNRLLHEAGRGADTID